MVERPSACGETQLNERGETPIDAGSPALEDGPMTATATAELLHGTPHAPHGGPAPVARTLLTRAGEDALRLELERLRHQLKADFSERLREARDFGEIHENDDYLQIKEEEAVVASRIHQLEALLDSATVVDDSDTKRGVVSVGSTVKVKNLASRDVREHRLTGGYEPMGANDISANSPVGQALIGRRRGDEVTVALPGDRAAVLEITAVRSPRRS